MIAEPIVQLEDLRRSFTIRRKAGRLRRQTKIVDAVDGITASIQPRGSGWIYRSERCREIHHHQDADRHPGSH